MLVEGFIEEWELLLEVKTLVPPLLLPPPPTPPMPLPAVPIPIDLDLVLVLLCKEMLVDLIGDVLLKLRDDDWAGGGLEGGNGGGSLFTAYTGGCSVTLDFAFEFVDEDEDVMEMEELTLQMVLLLLLPPFWRGEASYEDEADDDV